MVDSVAETLHGSAAEMLTEQLREVAVGGIVRRQPSGAVLTTVEYSLTNYGQSVLPVVKDVRFWGRVHMERLTSGD